MSDAVGWALERWPFAVAVIAAFGLIFGGMLFGWGPEIIRPVSAQTMQEKISVAKAEVLTINGALQGQLNAISGKQDAMEKRQLTEARDRLEQQLLWYRQQNCKSKDGARNYTWQKMTELRDRYRELTNLDWQMPACSDIGE